MGEPHPSATRARALASALRDSADNLPDLVNSRTGCLEVHHLSPLGWYVAEEAVRLGHYSKAQLRGLLDKTTDLRFDPNRTSGKSPFSAKHLQLILFIMRRLVDVDVPIAVVGGAQIRRSVSVVAVDMFRAPVSVELDGEAWRSDTSGPPDRHHRRTVEASRAVVGGHGTARSEVDAAECVASQERGRKGERSQ